MAYNVVAALLSWQLILPHLTVVQASTHWVVTEDGRIQAQVAVCMIVIRDAFKPTLVAVECFQCFDTVGWAAGRASGL